MSSSSIIAFGLLDVTNSLCIVLVCADVALITNQTSITQISSYHARHLIQNQQAALLQSALYKLHFVAELEMQLVYVQRIQQPNSQHRSPQCTSNKRAVAYSTSSQPF